MAEQATKNDLTPTPGKLSAARLKASLRIFRFVKPYRLSILLGLFLLFLSSMVFMIFPFMTGHLVDIALGNSKYDYTLKDVGIFLALVLIAQSFVSFYRVRLFAVVSERGIADVRKALYEKLLSLPIVFFEKTRTGELVSRLTADVEKLYHVFSITLAELIRQVLILVSGIVILAIMTPRLALVMLATFPIIVIGAMFFGKYIRKLSKQRQEELANSNIVLTETMQAIHAVKAFTNEWFELNRYRKSIDTTVEVSMKFAAGRALFTMFIVTLLFGALFFIVWQGAVMVHEKEMLPGQLISFMFYTASIGVSIAGIGNFYTEILGAVGATERVQEILDEPGEVSAAQRLPPSKRLNGNIEFEDVHFNYPTRTDVPVLKGISFQIPAGQKVALVGPSGAGKSTIVQLILKFYEVERGHIRVDGTDIHEMETGAYRQHLAIVPQEVLLFGGSIRENILYGNPDATDAEIVEAAKQANAWEFIQTFPEQLETVVGERGIKLSGGQRQRIAIARAILKDPAILLLDEATSSLDAESEKLVQEALDKLMEGRTSVIIAHRLATVRNVDCIYVIEHGRILEKGTHEELSEMEDGMYNSLAKLQFELV